MHIVCVCYHAWRISVLESIIQLLSRWTTAQDEGKDVLRRNYMTYRKKFPCKNEVVNFFI